MYKTDEKMTRRECGTEKQEIQLKIDKYSDMLFKLCLIRLKNMQDAEDVVQETLYQYVKREEDFEGEEHEKAWLIRVALNACRKIHRSAWQRYRNGENWQAAEELLQGTAASDEMIEEKILKKETSRILLQAVWELPLKYREVIHLFYYEGLTVKEIAHITNRKEATITSQLTRGRTLLKKILKEEYDFA